MSDQRPDNEDTVSFEDAHEELEEIVRTLERGEISLERTLELWERGEKLYEICTARLDAAHGRVEELTRELAAEQDDPALADEPKAESDPDDERSS